MSSLICLTSTACFVVQAATSCSRTTSRPALAARSAQSSYVDTLPPLLHSYRAILFRDGRIGIQVQAGDRDSGIPERGVTSQYSIDGGGSWTSCVHSAARNDFGHPALFEATLGPFQLGTRVLLAISARDATGNVASRIPSDAVVFVAPANAERALDAYGTPSVGGNPVFDIELLTRLRDLADNSAPTELHGQPRNSTAAFERRRYAQLSALPSQLRSWSIDVTQFRRVDTRVIRSASLRQKGRLVVRVRGAV